MAHAEHFEICLASQFLKVPPAVPAEVRQVTIEITVEERVRRDQDQGHTSRAQHAAEIMHDAGMIVYVLQDVARYDGVESTLRRLIFLRAKLLGRGSRYPKPWIDNLRLHPSHISGIHVDRMKKRNILGAKKNTSQVSYATARFENPPRQPAWRCVAKSLPEKLRIVVILREELEGRGAGRIQGFRCHSGLTVIDHRRLPRLAAP